MKPGLLAIFLTIVLVPAALIAWLGLRVSEEEQHRERRQLRALMNDALVGTRTGIDRLVQERARLIFGVLERAGTVSDEARREISRSNPWVRQLFVLNPRGQFLFPNLDEPAKLTRREREFFARTRAMWESGPVFGGQDEKGRAQSQGWHTWFWNDGLHILAWSRNVKTGEVVGAEIERMRLLADLLGSLPSTGTHEDLPEQSRIQLRDVSDRLLYAWGGFVPGDGDAPLTELKLNEPLSGWRLEYFSNLPIYREAGSRSLASIAWMVGLTIVASLALAAYFYREYCRDMREAGQRVTFVNQVSHELKTPLTNIRMYAERLQTKLASDDAETRRGMEVIVDESQRLSRLIRNVLTFSRARQDKLEIRKKPGVIDEVIATAIGHFRPSLENLGFEIDFERNAGERCEFDPDALEQILINLIGNVEKYAPEGKFLGIRSQLAGSTCTVRVCDRGPGIPATQVECIFQPFERLSNKLSDAAGTGIGLNIARNLARMHGGDVEIAPEPRERGACFVVTLRVGGNGNGDG